MPAWSGNGVGLPGVHGGGDGGAGLVGVVDSLLQAMTNALDSGSGSGGGLFGGIAALGFNVHPMVVHYPIAFLSAFFVLEIVGLAWQRSALRKLATGLLYLGALGALAAVAAGLIAAGSVPHGEEVHEIMQWHERLGITVAVLATGLAVWRALAKADFSGMAEALYLSLAGMVITCMVFGADLGGQMVYQYGVAVKSLQQAEDASLHQHADQAAAPSAAAPPARPEPAAGQAPLAPAGAAPDASQAGNSGSGQAAEDTKQEATDHVHHHHHHHHQHAH